MNRASKILCLLLFAGIGHRGVCQSTVFSVMKDPMKLANENYAEGNYADAIRLYQSVLSKNPGDATTQLRLAQANYRIKNYQRSVSLYNTYLSNGSKELPATDMFTYAEAQAALNNHSVALTYYKRCLEREPSSDLLAKKIWRINNMIYLYEDSSRYTIRPLGINTSYGELCPVPYKDGLVFTSNRKITRVIERVNAKVNEPFYQLYKASWKKDSIGQIGSAMAEPKPFSAVNSMYNTGPAAFFLGDQQMVFVASSATPDESENRALGLYFTSLENGKWTAESSFPYNSDQYSISDVAISEDGTRLFFSSDMKGGQGGKDIYSSQWKEGKWSKPVNLGDDINTSQNEIFPYIHSDGNLYFSSDGLPGLGQLDVFKSEIKPDGYGEPQNVGYPINSSYDDFGLAFDSLSTHGYFSSNRKKGGYDDDIYEFDMDLQKYPITIAGIMKYKEHTWSEQSAIKAWPNVRFSLIDSRHGKSVYRGVTGVDGNFSITIPYFSKYFLQIVDETGNEHKASLEIAKYRSEISSHEIVVVKDIFSQKEEKK